MTKPVEDPLVAQAFKVDKHEELARAIEKLTPEEAEFFIARLEAAVRKRKIQISGYLAAMLVWIVGMMFALVWYGTHDGFTGWAFILPFGLVGGILYAFGKWADRVGAAAGVPTATVRDAK